MRIIFTTGRAIAWVLGTTASLATISATWFVSSDRTKTEVVSEIIEKLGANGFDISEPTLALATQGQPAAIEAIITSVGTPPNVTNVFEAEIGRVYELTAKLIPYQITEVTQTGACTYINNGGGCGGLGDYRTLEDTGCEVAVLGTTPPNKSLGHSGSAQVRVRCD